MLGKVFLIAFVLSAVMMLCSAAASPPSVVTLPFEDPLATNVTEISTLDDAIRMLRNDTEVFVVYIYDSLDVNSWRAANTIAEAAGLLKGFVEVVAIDTRNHAVAFLLSSWNVQIVPTLVLLPSQMSHRAALGSGLKGVGGVKKPVEYSEPDMHPETIKGWALKGLPSNLVERMDDGKLQGLIKAAETAQSSIVVLLTDKDQTPPLLRRLSLKFYQRIGFAEVNSKKCPKIVKHFGVTAFPTLLVFPGAPYGQVGKAIPYSGPLKVQDISTFLDPFGPTLAHKESHRRHAEESALRRERRRLAEDVLEITNRDDWAADVLARQSLVGILFVDTAVQTEDSAADLADRLNTLAEVKRRSGRSSVVSQYVWVRSSHADRHRILDLLGGASEDRSPVLVYLHPSKGAFTRFVGAFSVDGVMQFVAGKLRSGMSGSKAVDVAKLEHFD